MHYPYYQYPELFQPSLSTLKLWLNTRKQKTSRGAGLFETDRFVMDRNWFLIAIVIEIVAFVLTIWGGYVRFSQTGKIKILIIATIASVLFVVLDYFGVLLHHRGTDDRANSRSQLNFVRDPVTLGVLMKKAYPGITAYQVFGFLCMSVSALLKITALIILLPFLRRISLVIISFYLIVLYVHAKHTGFWYFAWKTKNKIKGEYKLFETAHASNMPSDYRVQSPPFRIQFYSYYQNSSLNEACLNGRVHVKYLGNEIDNGETRFHYEMTCEGILWDADIVKITQEFNIHFQQDLYEGCVKIQHAQLGNPVAYLGTPNVIAPNDDDGSN
jgi:hypothetical protein